MKVVKKFTTFEELKSTERDTKNPVERLKKHEAFEKVIKEIRADKVEKEIIPSESSENGR
ncbi:MAG: hypothetical protein ACTHM5_12475 [Ginsengibacter sp.]